jgi:hypothetical protein
VFVPADSRYVLKWNGQVRGVGKEVYLLFLFGKCCAGWSTLRISPSIADLPLTILPLPVQISMITPKEFVGPLMELAQGRRGEFTEMKYLTETRCELVYELPLGEVRARAPSLSFLSGRCTSLVRGRMRGKDPGPHAELHAREIAKFTNHF